MDVDKVTNVQALSETGQSDLWRRAVEQMKMRLNEQSFRNWIEPARFQKMENETLYLEVPDKFYSDWLRTHYHELIRESVQNITHSHVEIEYVHSQRSVMSALPVNTPFANQVQELGLNDRYSFENFVIGPGNRFAHAAAIAVSEAPARNYNPLFIYGRVGLGKTHLLQAVAQHIVKNNLTTKVVYISGEKFTNQLITAIQKRTTGAFRATFRSADLLLIDDIHFIAGKESTQEEFFHTFNTLYDAHKQIIVSSDRPPKEIPGLEDRLISRFGWGLVADIQPPDFETRVAILKKKMERETVVVPDEVVHFIADKIKSNIRELEGALIRVVAFSQLTGSVVDVRTVEGEILKDTLQEEIGNVTIDRIQKVICDYFRLKLSDLRAKKRSKSIAYPRQIGMYLVRQMTDHSLPEIGGYFGGRGHATVIHACNKIDRLLLKGGKIHQIIKELKTLIKNA